MIDDFTISTKAAQTNLNRIVGQIFRLLPTREENGEWQKPLETIVVELLGMSHFFEDQTDICALVCKLQGLLEGVDSIDFMLFRRTIFEACSMTSALRESLNVNENISE